MSDKVAGWLEQLGLGQYAEAFQENAITLEHLSDLDHETLKELGVRAVGHRMTILKAADNLKGLERIEATRETGRDFAPPKDTGFVIEVPITPEAGEEQLARRRRRRWIVLIILGIALIGGGFAAWKNLDRGPSIEARFQRALAFKEQGDLRAALIELKNILNTHPDHAQARYQLAQAYVALGDGAGAEKELERARALGIEGAEVELVGLKALVLQGKYEAVLREAKTIGDGEFKDAVLVLQGTAYLGLGEPDKAKRAFDEALRHQPDNQQARLGLARVALIKQDALQAERHLDALIAAAPEDSDAWLLKGELALAHSEFETAEEAFETILSIDESNLPARLGLTRALVAQEKTDAADAQLKRLAERLPKNPSVNFLIALVAGQREDWDAAKIALQDVLNVAPNHGDSLLKLASIHYSQGSFEQAESLLVRAVALAPTEVAPRKLLGAAQMKLKRPAEAIQTLEVAATQPPEDAQLLALLGSAYLQNGQYTEGMEHLMQANAIAPDATHIRAQLAVGHLRQGETDRAIAGLESVVELDPSLVQADLLLVLSYMHEGAFDKAMDAAMALVEKRPNDPVPLTLLGGAYEGKGDLASARAQFERALALEPDFVPAELHLARLDVKAGEVEQARARYAAILERHPTELNALMRLAELENASGRIDEAVALLERARAAHRQALQPRLTLADYYRQVGQTEKALTLAREAQALAPDHPATLLTLGKVQLAMGEADAALTTFERLTARSPESTEAHYQLALARRATGDTSGARSALRRSLERDANHVPAKVLMGKVALRAGNTAEALTIAKRLQAEHPDEPRGYALEGDVLIAQRQYPDAASAYEAALRVEPHGRWVIGLYRARQGMGDRNAAEATLRDWLAKHPEDGVVRNALANALIASDREDEAIDEYIRVLDSDPDNAVALNNVAVLYERRGDPRMLKFAERAYRQAPNRPDVMDTYGWALVQTGNAEQGLGLLEKALELAPNNAEFRYHRAIALAVTGQVAAARRELEALLQSGESFPQRDEVPARLEELRSKALLEALGQ